MTSIFMAVIEWGIVPIILFGILVFTLLNIPDSDAEQMIKVSVRAAKWAGLVILILFILSQKNREMIFSFKIPTYTIHLLPILFYLIIGFLLTWLFDYIKRRRILGIFVLANVATTSITFYSYIFIPNVRNTVVVVALGIVLGVLFYEILSPYYFNKSDEILNREKKKSDQR